MVCVRRSASGFTVYAYSNPTVYIDPDGHIVAKHAQDAFNKWGDENIEAAASLMASDSVVDRAVGGLSAVMGGFSKAVAFGFGALNYVENQAILGASQTGIIPESSVDLAGKQTADVYQGIENAANALGSEKGRAQLGEKLSDHMDKLAAGEEGAVASTLGFLGESVVPVSGGLSAAGATSKALATAASNIAKSKAVVTATKTVERTIISGGNRIAAASKSVGSGFKEAAKTVVQTSKQAAITVAKRAMQPGPGKYRAQIGAVGDVSKVKLGSKLNASKKSGADVTKGGRNLPFKDKDRVTEINKTLDRIDGNGPFPHKRDGITFKNREGKLPDGNYKEYTVDTPGASNRGARRVVRDQHTGNTYYTDDHYKNFIQIDPTKN